jgi:predicted DNA-binding transcriptional regulator AlpA
VSDADPLLIPDTIAAALAGVSRATWHRLRAAGKLPPSVQLNRAVRWRRAEILAWIEGGCPDARTWAAMTAAAGRRLKVPRSLRVTRAPGALSRRPLWFPRSRVVRREIRLRVERFCHTGEPNSGNSRKC